MRIRTKVMAAKLNVGFLWGETQAGEFAPQNSPPVHHAVLAALLVECEQEKLLSSTSHLSSVLQQANKLSSNFPDSCRDVTKTPSKDVMTHDAKTKETGNKIHSSCGGFM